jgi:hypothetical protein
LLKCVLCRMESATKELCTLLSTLQWGVALKVTDYLGDCRYSVVYSPYIIIWCGFEVFIWSVAWPWQHRSCFFDADGLDNSRIDEQITSSTDKQIKL